MYITQKDIEVSQGETTNIFFRYIDSFGNGIDLEEFTAMLAFKRFPTSEKLILLVTHEMVVHGGEFGEFTTSGFAGVGNSQVNVDSDISSLTGGILFQIDKQSMAYVPVGRNFYEVSIINGQNVQKIFEGRVDVRPDYVRIEGLSVSPLPVGGTNYTVGSEPPTLAQEGDRWWNTEISAEFVYLPIAEGGGFIWVQTSGGMG
jgi:hypothetical protein